MTRKFIITGLPRSRTAWLANFFTYGPSFCFHEGLEQPPHSPADLLKQMDHEPFTWCGNSDSGWPLFDDGHLLQDYNCKLVIVWRNPSEVLQSLAKIYPGQDFMPLVSRSYSALKTLHVNRKCYLIRFHDFNSETMREMWDYIFEGAEAFPEARYHLLADMKVCADSWKKLADQMRRRV